MKEEWLFPGAVVPVDAETTAALVAEIHRLIDVVGGMALAQPEQEPVATLLLQSKQNFERNFGPHWQADWVYSDLAELLEDHIPDAGKMVLPSRIEDLLAEDDMADSAFAKDLREALAQPEQEPVAWMHKIDCDRDDRDDFMAYYKRTPGYCIPLYTAPPQRKPLTDEQLPAMWTDAVRKAALPPNKSALIHYKEAIEAHYGIKEKP